MLVDLPGYGFAHNAKTKINSWNRSMGKYFRERGSVLKRVFVLIDSRHGLLNNDYRFINFLEACKIPFQFVLTKVDRLHDDKFLTLIEKIKTIVSAYSCCNGIVNAVSTKVKNHDFGLVELRECILHILQETEIQRPKVDVKFEVTTINEQCKSKKRHWNS